MTYAAGTGVTVANSQQEIARTLTRYQIDTYSFGQSTGFAQVAFEVKGLPVRIDVPLPVRPDKQFGKNPTTGRQIDAWKMHDQTVRERWRCLLLFIKASLESSSLGFISVEQAFMAFIVTADGDTVGDKMLPRILAAVADGQRLAIGS